MKRPNGMAAPIAAPIAARLAPLSARRRVHGAGARAITRFAHDVSPSSWRPLAGSLPARRPRPQRRRSQRPGRPVNGDEQVLTHAGRKIARQRETFARRTRSLRHAATGSAARRGGGATSEEPNDAEAWLQTDVGGARPGRPGAQRPARRGGGLRLRGDLRSLLALARGAGPCAARLGGARRPRQRDPAHRADDRGDLPDDALPSGHRRSGRGDDGPAQRQSLHARARRRRAPQRARRRRRLARNRRASRAPRRGRRHHPGPAGGRADGLPRPALPPRPRPAVRPPRGEARGGDRGRRPRGGAAGRPQGRRPDRHRAARRSRRGVRRRGRVGATLRRGSAMLCRARGRCPQDGAPLLSLGRDRLAGHGGAARYRRFAAATTQVSPEAVAQVGELRPVGGAASRGDRSLRPGRLRPSDPDPGRARPSGVPRIISSAASPPPCAGGAIPPASVSSASMRRRTIRVRRRSRPARPWPRTARRARRSGTSRGRCRSRRRTRP